MLDAEPYCRWMLNYMTCTSGKKMNDREEMVKTLANIFLSSHEEMARFLAGFGKVEACECSGCRIARKLLETPKERLEGIWNSKK